MKGRIIAVINIITYVIEVIFLIILLLKEYFDSQTPLSLAPGFIITVWIIIMCLHGAFVFAPIIFNASDFYDLLTDKIGINFALI